MTGVVFLHEQSTCGSFLWHTWEECPLNTFHLLWGGGNRLSPKVRSHKKSSFIDELSTIIEHSRRYATKVDNYRHIQSTKSRQYGRQDKRLSHWPHKPRGIGSTPMSAPIVETVHSGLKGYRTVLDGTVYGTSKKEGERVCLQQSRKHLYRIFYRA